MMPISMEDPAEDLLHFFASQSTVHRHRSPQMSKAIMEEVKRTGITGDSKWKFMGYWMGEHPDWNPAVEHLLRMTMGAQFKKRMAILLTFRHLPTSDLHWFQARSDPEGKQWSFYYLQRRDVLKYMRLLVDIPTFRKMHENYKSVEDNNFADELIGEELEQMRSQNEQQRHEFNAQIMTLQTQIEAQRRGYEELEEQHQRELIGMVCAISGGLAFVFFIIVLVLHRRWKRQDVALCEQDILGPGQKHVGDTVIPGKLKNNRPPMLVDECEKFGMNEIYGVTAGEEGDLVRIARPLETAGASRKLSEALMNIHPIYQDREGMRRSQLRGASFRVTRTSNKTADGPGE